MARWHQHLRYFYEPTPEILRGLGQMYNQHPDFIANFQQMHPDLPAFLEAGRDALLRYTACRNTNLATCSNRQGALFMLDLSALLTAPDRHTYRP